MYRTALLLLWAGAAALAAGPSPAPPPSRCHVFIDTEYIWTLEVVHDSSGAWVPVLNILNLTGQTSEFRTRQVHIHNAAGEEAEVKKFSVDTGLNPYKSTFLRVVANGFIGLDLLGDFKDFQQPARVELDLGETRFHLEPIDCMDFDMLAGKINKINFDSPDITQDYEALQIHPRGTRTPLPPEN